MSNLSVSKESNLILDAETLRTTADIISAYTLNQREVMLNYLKKIMALSNEWKDDETFSKLFSVVTEIHSKVITTMEQVNVSATYFRAKAEQIESRPIYNKTSSSSFEHSSTASMNTSTISTNSSLENREYSSLSLMSKMPLNCLALNDEMCEFDRVGRINNYVKVSSNDRRIDCLEYVGTFLSPANGEKIYCKSIAWRCYGIGEPNAQNVCGADFYYADGTFCGSYVGKDWRDIYENNLCDTKRFRK